jgi:hypothetical protein
MISRARLTPKKIDPDYDEQQRSLETVFKPDRCGSCIINSSCHCR